MRMWRLDIALNIKKGTTDAECPICRKLFPPTKLLFPVEQKDYTSNEYIKGCWDATGYIIENSYMLTIFGYSTPSSDKEAVNLLKKEWVDLDKRQLEEVSVIDVVSEDEILRKWNHFIYSHHYRYTNNFFDSYLGMFPRRSCETVFATVQLNVSPDCNLGFKPKNSINPIPYYLLIIYPSTGNFSQSPTYPLFIYRR